MVTQGEIWWAEIAPKRRPVLILSRSEVIPVLHSVVVAPITRTVRGIPTEVDLDEADGLSEDCVASLDNVRVIEKTALTRRIGRLANGRRVELCEALAAVADC